MPRKPKLQACPPAKQILDFIAQSGQPAGKREIARAFGLSGHDKILLKALLKDMADEGLIDSAPGRAFHKAGGVPKVTVLRVAVGRRRRQVWAVPEQLARRDAGAEAARDRAGAALGARRSTTASSRAPRSAGRAMSPMPMKKLARVGRAGAGRGPARRATASG